MRWSCYQSILASRPQVTVEGGKAINSLIRDQDIVIGPASTVLAQAALLGKKVVCVNYTRFTYPPPFAGKNGFPLATTPAELAELLREAINRPAPSGRTHPIVLYRYLGTLDGKSCERLLSSVRDFCERRCPAKG